MSIYTELWNRIGEIGKDLGGVIKRLESTRLAAHIEGCSIYRTGRDGNGVFTTINYNRLDNSLAKSSVLSLPDGNSRYTRRVETFYDTNGTTVITTRTYTISYNGTGEMISEVITS